MINHCNLILSTAVALAQCLRISMVEIWMVKKVMNPRIPEIFQIV